MPAAELTVDSRRLARWILAICIVFELAFVVLDYTVNYSYGTERNSIRRMFNITREDGLASWFAVTQAAFMACTLWLIYALSRVDPMRRPGRSACWIVVAVYFTCMAIDDGGEIHERVGTAFKDSRIEAEAAGASRDAGSHMLDAFPSYSWQLLFLPLYGGLGLFALAFLFQEFNTPRQRMLLLGAFALLGFAVALDFVEGLEPEHRWNAYTWIVDNWNFDAFAAKQFRDSAYEACRHFSKSIEEFAEMLAGTLLWTLCVAHLGQGGARIVRLGVPVTARP